MSNQVRVQDLDVFRQFRVALLKFAQAADQALTGADAHVARTRLWLENEQTRYWQLQLRKRTEAVVAAKDAVRQKKLYRDSTGRTPSARRASTRADGSAPSRRATRARSPASSRITPWRLAKL